MSNTVPQDRVRIFSRERYPLAEFRVNVNRSWSIMGEGRAQFTYPTRHRGVVTEQNLQFGNYLLVENDTLPAWVGVIDTPQQWGSRHVTVSAYTPERILAQRVGVMEWIAQGSSGALFNWILNKTNIDEITALTAGEIWSGSKTMQETFHPTPLSNNLKSIRERSGNDYRWRPVTAADGKLIIYADWYERLGLDYDVLLHEGTGGGNIEAGQSILTVDGTITNSILGYVKWQTWASSPWIKKIDDVSAEKYGFRAIGKQYEANSYWALLGGITDDLPKNAYPKKRFMVNALNVGDTFKYIGLGNSLRLQMQNIGFTNGVVGYEGQTRIIGMAYNPQVRNKIGLVMEEM